MKDKIRSLMGFAVKAGKIIYGSDSVESAHKKCYLMFLCKSLAENTRKKALNFAEQKKIPVIESDIPLQDIVNKTNCKVLAVTDKQMAEAMIKQINENYHLHSSEVK